MWNHSTFSKNRERLLFTRIAQRLFDEIRKQAYARQLLSRDHFSVDGTLIDASASMKSSVVKTSSEKPRGDASDEDPPGRVHNAAVDFKGERRSNKTHASTTDPDARLFRQSADSASWLCMTAHILVENRCGFIVNALVSEAGIR